MSSFINNGLSGLLAAQRALQVTSNNVANSMTEGYARQRVEFAERPSQVAGGGLAIGNGVGISGINRVYDQFVADELKGATSSQQRAQTVSDLAGRVDNLLGNPDSGISQSVQSFFSQAEALNRDPTSAVNRQQLLAEGNSLAQRFGQLDNQLGRINGEINGRLQEGVNRINGIAESLANVNDRIAGSTVSNPNDLLDEQERLLNELSGLVDFNAVRQTNGSLNVMVGTGQPLVLNNSAFKLETVQNEFDGTKLELGYQGKSISGTLSGGEMAGLLAFRNDILDGSRQELGQLALGITEVFNAQHRQGMDLDGQLGGDFFAAVQPTSTPSANNSGTASLGVAIGDASAVEARDYILRYTGSAWELMDANTQAPVAMSGSGTAGDPLVAEGLEIVTGAGADAGDRFRITAASAASTNVGVVLTDPRGIAAASPLASAVSLSNLSAATISNATVDDLANPNLLRSVEIRFDNPTTYRIFDTGGTDLSGPQAYTAGSDISFQGFTVQINGAAGTGDSFTVNAAGPGSGDNSNALALSEIGATGFFNNGELSITNVGANLVANVGSAAARANNELSVQTLLRDQAELDVESISGVNLEEEAVNMLRYQEAYLAASKIINVANDLFQTLIGVVGR